MNSNQHFKFPNYISGHCFLVRSNDYLTLIVDGYKVQCYELKSLGLDKRTTLVISNTRELDRDLFTN